jgi:tRNA (mo5U34)-methyltransferase
MCAMRLPPRKRAAAQPRAPAIAPDLQAEVDRAPWMYEWQLNSCTVTPVIGDNLRAVHRTRQEMSEAVVRRALASAGPDARALDLGCNEGMFAHRLLEWGAAEVVGVDTRPENIRRARLVRDHFGMPPERLRLQEADALAMSVDAYGTFDVVLVLGLIYHLEQPLEAIRVARRLCRNLCVIESQLTRQNEPIVRGDGIPNVFAESAASFAAWVEADSEANPLSSMEGVMSLVPNRAALELMPRWAGFDEVELLDPRPEHDVQYVQRDRGIVAAWVRNAH